MQITVLSAVKTQAISKAGKPYAYLELAYKGEDGQVKGKKIMPFGESKIVFDVLATAGGGDFFNITSIKNETSGFWDWTAAMPSTGGTPAPAAAQAAAGGKVVGSNYETAEERAKKQVYIVRQSSISNAISLDSTASVEDVLKTAKKFENYVFSTGVIPVAVPMDDFENDIPL